MITISSPKIKSFSQKNYNEIIDKLQFHSISCTCGQKGQLIRHGYYTRSIKTPSGLKSLKILRVKCNHCNRTHAILLDFIVPYSRITLEDHLAIIKSFESKQSYEPIMLLNPYIDEGNIVYVIKQYLHHWKQKLFAFGLSINNCLIKNCFFVFKRQFMQIKRTLNILFLETT